MCAREKRLIESYLRLKITNEMRRLKPVSLHVKNTGRDGKKTTVSIPLKVDSWRQPKKSTQENSKEIDSPEEQNVPLHDLENQPSTSQPQNRVLSISGNWEKIREKLLNSYIEEQQLPDKVICVIINCEEVIATTRSGYCGPNQYFPSLSWGIFGHMTYLDQ